MGRGVEGRDFRVGERPGRWLASDGEIWPGWDGALLGMEMWFDIRGTVTTVSLILSWNKVLVRDGEVGVLRGDFGGGIFGFEARSRASLNTDDIFADVPELRRRKRRFGAVWEN